MTPEQETLLLTVAAILRTHLSEYGGNDRDIAQLRAAMAPFEVPSLAFRADMGWG